MSFWTTIGKIGAGIAAPFTGGASLAAIPLLDTIGQDTNAIEQGRTQGRMTQAQYQQQQDRLALQRYQEQNDAARTNLAVPAARANASVKGDVLAGAQPFKFTGGTSMVGNIPVPQSTGGLNPGLFSANTRALGGQMSADALSANTADHGQVVGQPPPLTPLPESGVTDNILNTASLVGGLGSDFASIYNKYKKPQPYAVNGPNEDPNSQVDV